MTWLIYTFGNGNMLFDVFTSISLMVGAGYESLIRLAMLGLTIGALAYIIGRGRAPWQLLCGAIMLFAVTVQIRANVTIQDLVNPGVPTRTVANIPLAVAFPAYVASEAGFQLLTLAETAFALTVPPEYQVINATLGKGFYDLQKLLGVQLPDGDLQRNLTEYIKECVIPALQRGELTNTAVFDAQDMLAAINVGGGLDVMRPYVAGVRAAPISCTNAYTNFIVPGMAPGGDVTYDLAMKQLRQAFGVPDVALGEEVPVTTAMTRILGTGQLARAAINNVLIRERWQSAEELINQRGNDPAAAIALLGKQLGEDLKSQAFSQSIMNARFLPMLRTMAESCVYFLTPFALVLAFTPSMFGTIRSTIMAYSWLLLWAPLYGIVNYLMYAYGTVQLTSLVPPGVGITYANYVDFYDILNQLNSFASSIAWGVPTMAAMLSYGLGSAVSSLSSAGQGFQAAASQEASQLAHGQFKYTDPNRHLEYQDQMSIDAAGHEHHDQMLRASSGILSVNQTGTREISFSDSSHTTIGTTGILSHQGPDGYYTQDKDGHYLSGVWRQDVQDEESGKTISMQREVLGAEIRSRGAYEDANGVQHHVEQMENQYDHSQLYREESWSADGVQHVRLTQGDGSKVWKTDGFVVTAPVGPDGRPIGTPRPFREQNTFVQPAPTDGNPNPGWEHQYGELTGGHDGQEHYAIRIDTSGESPEAHDYVRYAMGGTKNNNVGAKTTHRGLSVSQERGSEANVGSIAGSVPMDFIDKNGNRHSSEAIVLGNGIPLDHEGNPEDGFAAHAVTNDDGKRGVHEGTVGWNKDTGKWEMHETDAQYYSRIESHKSGSRMFLPSAGLTLESGTMTEHGSGNQTSFLYEGVVTDRSGHSFRARVEGKDGKIAYSDLVSGGTQHVVADDGHRLMLFGKPGGEDFTYQEDWTGPAFRDDGHGHLTPIGQTHFTSRGHAKLDPSRGESLTEQLVKTPDTTVAENKSAFGERSLAVNVSERPLSELPIGSASMAVDREHGREEVEGTNALYGGDGKGYVILAGAGTERSNWIRRTQNVQTPDGRLETRDESTDSSGTPISGNRLGVVDSKHRNEKGHLVSQTLAAHGGGEEVLTQTESNENSFLGTFSVPRLDGSGWVTVSGKIEWSPQGEIVSMNFTNAATGKQVGYRSSERGPIFTVADVESDPRNPSKGRLTNQREVSHREAESAGGFYIRDVVNQAGQVISSQGEKGTNRAEFNQYTLHTKIGEESTLVGKGQQSLEALGMAEPFNPDQPGPWKDAARAAEGFRLGWNIGMEGMRAMRFMQWEDRITGGGGNGPYDPNAPSDPALKETYDAATKQVEEFLRKRGISPRSRKRS
jgi:hypothetical protein